MPRTRNEPDAQRLDVVDGVVERVNLEFATIAGARIDLPDAQRAAEHLENAPLQRLAHPQTLLGRRRVLGDDPDPGDLLQCFQHGR